MRSEIRDGVYTGQPAGPFTYREGKAEAIRQVAASEGFDLSESYAYSDSESDLPMLRAVGHPVAVNPDSELEHVARQEGWQVITFDRLRHRVRVAAAIAALSATGGGAGYVVARLRPSRRERMWRSIRRRRG
jgi:phosphoserine phosphatase